MKKIVSKVLVVALLTTSVNVNTNVSQAATTLKVSTNAVSLTVGKTKVVSANKKVTWSSTNKKIAKVKKINSKKAKISAVKSGSCKIIAKYKKQKKTIKVTVKKQTSNKVSVSPTPIVTDNPNVTSPTPDITPIPEVTVTPAADIYVETAAQITVKTVSSSATGVRLEVRNDNSTEVIYGKAYQIQKLVNGNWENVKPIAENIMFPAVGISIFGNTTGHIDVDWTDYYGKLENGQYRIVKEYSVGGVLYKIAAPFELKDTLPTPDNTPMPEVTATPAADIYVETAAQVTVKTVSGSATGARLEVRNDNSTEVIYGKAYQIQKLVNGNWENVKPIAENIMFPAVGISIFGNTTGHIDVDWTDYYGKLENGQYRIVKEYSVGGELYKIAASFQLEDTDKAGKDGAENQEMYSLNNVADITVKTVSSSATNARLEIKNGNSTEVIYGQEYQIQKLENGSWENMKPIAENMVFPMIGMGIPSNTTEYIDIDWSDYYGKLESGQYVDCQVKLTHFFI